MSAAPCSAAPAPSSPSESAEDRDADRRVDRAALCVSPPSLRERSAAHARRNRPAGGARIPPQGGRGDPPLGRFRGRAARVASPTMREITNIAASATDAVKVYGSGDGAVRALDGISVEFERARFTAIMGPSGSGKSTLMHCVAGLDRLTSGSVAVGGRELATLSDRRADRAAPRRDRLRLPVLQPAADALGAREHHAAAGPRRPASRMPPWEDEVVATLGLGDRLSHRPSELSGGQQQRVAVARALVARPQLTFADEPTGNLDSTASAELLAFLRRAVHELGQTIVMVTHDPLAAALRRPRAVPRRRPARRRGLRPRPRACPRAPRPARRAGGGMTRIALKSVLARKRRLAGAFLAVFLGVSFLAGTLALGATLQRNFDVLFADANAGTDAVVRSATPVAAGAGFERETIDAATVARVRAVEGAASVGAVRRGLRAAARHRRRRDRRQRPAARRASWIGDPDLNAYRIVEGRAPRCRRTRSSSTAAPRSPAGWRSATRTTARDAAPGPGADRRHRDLRDGRRLRRLQLHGVHPRGGPAARRSAGAAGSAPSASRRRRARARTSWSRAWRACCPPGREAISGAAPDRGERRRHQRRLPRPDARVPGRVRRHRAARRRLQHPQHALRCSPPSARASRRCCALSAPRAARSSAPSWRNRCCSAWSRRSPACSAASPSPRGLKALFDAFGGALPDGGLVFEPGTAAIAIVVGVARHRASPAWRRPCARRGRRRSRPCARWRWSRPRRAARASAVGAALLVARASSRSWPARSPAPSSWPPPAA